MEGISQAELPTHHSAYSAKDLCIGHTAERRIFGVEVFRHEPSPMEKKPRWEDGSMDWEYTHGSKSHRPDLQFSGLRRERPVRASPRELHKTNKLFAPLRLCLGEERLPQPFDR